MDRLAIALGWADWEALAAALRTVSPDQPGRRAPADGGAPTPTPATRTGRRFSSSLEATLYRSVALAAERKHRYNTVEHLLLALLDDPDAAAVVEACAVDLAALRATLVRYVDEDLNELTKMGDLGVGDPEPTAGFHRVITRAVMHVQSAGRNEVTGANVLVAVFSERESHAAYFLQQQKMTQRDAVNFIAHGIRKGGAGGWQRRRSS
jgi:ATP-dependent Clp protease ATP-binding subunit ClpA